MSSLPRPLETREFARIITQSHQDNPNARYVFVLGAGASRDAEIPTGLEFVDRWLRELRVIRDPDSTEAMEAWATEERLGIPGFDFENRGKFYFQVYDQRFLTPADGFAYLQKEIGNRDPSYGHFVLAQILAGETQGGSRHNVVLTTNFDNLVERAVFWFTESFPLVLGHTSLAGFADTRLQRPVIMKVHNDLLLEPMSREREMQNLAEQWHQPITDLFKYYAPIFVGYDAHDHTLRGLLERMDESNFKQGFYWGWFVRLGETNPDKIMPRQEIRDLVARMNGRIFTYSGLDHLMWCFQDAFQLPDGASHADSLHKLRLERFDHMREEAIKKVRLAANKDPKQLIAIEKESERLARSIGDTPSAALIRLWGESDPEERLRLSEFAAKKFPNDRRVAFQRAYELIYSNHGEAAVEEAEDIFRKAIESDPSDADTRNFLGYLLEAAANEKLRGPEALVEAERLYREAIALDPNNSFAHHNLGHLLDLPLREGRHQPGPGEESEKLYRRAIELDPSNAFAHNYLGFLMGELAEAGLRKPEAYEEAVQLLQRAIALDPQYSETYYNLGRLLSRIAKRGLRGPEALDEARLILKTGQTLAPNNPDFRTLLEEIDPPRS